MRIGAALVALTWVGCFDTHDRDDAGVAVDGEAPGVDAGRDAPCPTLGGHRVCGTACPEPCPRETAAFCSGFFGICTPNRVDELSDAASLGGRSREYCYTAGPVAVPGSSYEPGTRADGLCLGREYCDDAAAAGLDIVCLWSDQSLYENGPPPDDRCPPPPDSRTPFCGGGCAAGGCPYHPDAFAGEWSISCAGVSETRGLGMCTFGTPSGCGEGEPNYATQCEPFYGQPCACLRLRQPSRELDARGFVTFAASCTAYRELYPDDVVCMDPFAWTPLP